MDRKIAWAAVVGLVTAVLAVAAAFNVTITSEQQDAIINLVVAAGPIATAVFAAWFTRPSEHDPSRRSSTIEDVKRRKAGDS